MTIRATPLDMAAAGPHIAAAARPFAPGVDLRVTAEDGMHGDDAHYLAAGSSGLAAVLAAVGLGGRGAPGSVLDFGSGAGRVTRWLRAAFPDARLSCCDLRPDDVRFCRDVFGAEGWVSGTDVEAISFGGRHDLVWMGSVLTHLDEATTRRLVDRAMAALTPGGLLVATTIGRAARAIQDADPMFLEGAGWPAVKRGYDERGYGYVDYDGERGYGLSLSSPAWVSELASRHAGRRLVMLSECAWDGTQDVFAIGDEPAFRADPVAETAREREVRALRARVAVLEGSASWRVTAPLRRLAGAVRRTR